MNREVHVRFWEGVGVRFPRATRLIVRRSGLDRTDMGPAHGRSEPQ